MMYESGNTIHDPEGNEWMIGHTWQHENYYCMFLIGMSGELAGQMGGHRVELEDRGLPVVTRR